MPAHVSILLLGLALLLVVLVWTIGLARLVLRNRLEIALWRFGHTLPGLPEQRQVGPHLESVYLTPAEEDEFTVLVRRLSEGR